MRVAACYAALVLRSAALRDENRFQLLELEDEKTLQEVHHQPEAFEEQMLDPDPSSVSTANCIDGTLHLRGQNVVNSELVFPKECATLRGDGAQVTLKGPLIFEGDLRMEGDIRFIAASSFWQSCVVVRGSASMFGNIHFESCHNKDTRANAGGGGLTVWANLTQHEGAIAFHNCSSEDRGGGLYVTERIAQNHGTMAFSGCSSKSNGGGLYVFETMTQDSGTMAFSNCSGEQGGGLYGGGIMQNNGVMAFSNCSSRGKGGGLVVSDMTQNHGTMEFSSCSSEYGGGFYVDKSMVQNSGTMAFSNCSSELDGGGICVSGDITQNGGVMGFSNCRSQQDGGGLHGYGIMTQNNGQMQFRRCRSEASGGGFYAGNSLIQNRGEMEFTNCSSGHQGGGLYAEAETTQNGTMEFHDCRGGTGGGLFANIMMQNGSMEFQNCSSETNGGGLYVSELTQNGAIEFKKCSSKENGGGVFAVDVVTQNGRMDFSNCSSGQGGGLHSSELHSTGRLHFSHCSATREGGCFYSWTFTQNGSVGFSNCSSQRSGGGLYVGFEYDFQQGAAGFHHCTAKEDGGGLWVHRFQQQAPVSFYNCRAAIGGGLSASTINGTQPMNFHECRATEAGGGLRLQGLEGSVLERFRAENCSAAQASAIQARNLTIKSLELVDTFNQTVDAVSLKVSTASFQLSETTKPDLSMEAVDLQIDSDVDCSMLRECRLVVTSSAPKLAGFQCSLGAGVAEHPAFGCLACPEGYTQIDSVTNGPCRQCPEGTSLCHAAKIQMMKGLMLQEGNVSRPLHCPSKAACRGGELPTTDSRPMCQKGYGGEGCSSCITDEGTLYLMPDSSVLACTPCARETASQLLQWCSFLAQRAVLFAVSAASIFAAGHADRVKNSGVYLNQLMAFAAVSGCVVTTVMQTEAAQTMKNVAVELFIGTAVFLSDAGSGQGSNSSHCLLSYLGLESTGLFGVHCLDVVVATSLVLLLSFKDFRVALVAGLNCFLPGILADFAKYAVCYRLEEEEIARIDHLICDHLPFSNLLGFIAVGASFLAVFALSLFVWIQLSTSQEAKEDELPSHVAFLTRKYGEGRRYFEAERLIRKVLLATAAALYPSTTFPALQMTSLTIIATASMLVYGVFQPYRQQLWNWSELGLLATALLLIAMASAVIWNEDRWDKTRIGQMSMVIALGGIVTAVCSAFMVKIALEVWRERQPADGSHP